MEGNGKGIISDDEDCSNEACYGDSLKQVTEVDEWLEEVVAVLGAALLSRSLKRDHREMKKT